MELKHTKGEWKTVNYNGTAYTAVMIESKEKGMQDILICDTLYNDTPNVSYEEAKANAKLIAAAPELLEALKQMVNASFSYQQNRDSDSLGSLILAETIAEEVIKKATE